MTDTHLGSSTNQIAHAVPLDAPHPNGFVAAGAETCWSRLDHGGGEMHDVFIVISEDRDGEHVARGVRRQRRRRTPNTPGKLPRRAHRGGAPMKPSRLVTFAACDVTPCVA